ncbi:hypothetical protein I6F07_11365 [Ensifer sp. IC4062]|nr:hypothetical protein [Ensifer sp. IC4062]MCA1440799.1 hypothetical protein [Ensifer sp. IC4062]
MFKTIRFQLKDFPVEPPSLLAPDGKLRPLIEIDLARLYHHYYFDSFGRAPPNPDPAHFEHLDLFTTDAELRARGDGLGDNPAFRQNKANELGQAFFRWFLYEHVGITYFGHMHHALQGKLTGVFGEIKVARASGGGEAPDYLCAHDGSDIYLGEAKGRVESVSFGSKHFENWRKQFDNIVVTDGSGKVCSLKGYVVATRFARESQPRVKSTLYAEDPATRGEPFRDGARPLRNAVVSLHYATIAEKLNQPLLSAALRNRVTVPTEIRFPAIVWECLLPPLAGRRFVGGYYLRDGGRDPFVQYDKQWMEYPSNMLRLDIATGTFFGLEELKFKQLVTAARAGTDSLSNLTASEDYPPLYSALSYLRDGSILGPLDLFRPVQPITL